jgi:hypothetical protein
VPVKRPAKGRGGKAKKKPRPRAARGRGILSRLRPPLLWALGLLLALAGVALAWWWEARGEAPAQTPRAAAPPATSTARAQNGAATSLPMPAYEEPPAADLGGRELQELDEALFAGLRLAGLEPAAVRLAVRATPRGEVAVLEAQLPATINPQAARDRVQERLAATQGRGGWRVSGQEMVLEVSLREQPTHLLRLLLPGPAPPAPSAPPRPRAADGRPQVAIVIDDLGYLQIGRAHV